jgi:PAS domain S-box-containing protein
MNSTFINIKTPESFKLEPSQVIRIFDLMPDLVYVLDLDKQSLLYTNDRLYDVLGYTWEDVIQMNYTLGPTMVHDDMPTLAAELSKTFDNLSEDNTTEFSINFKHKNGNIRELRNRATVMTRHPDGRNQFIVVVAEDITESRLYEKILAEKVMILERQRDQMEAAESIFSYGSWDYEPNESATTYSDGLLRLLGLSPDDYPDGKVERLFYNQFIIPEDKKMVANFLATVTANKEPEYYLEHQIIDTQGKLKHVAMKAKCFYDEEGKISRILGVIADRSEVEAYQIELERRLVALKKSNSELEQFAYIASHDLQEPLRKIISFGERLNHKYADNLGDDGRFYVDRMANAATRMQTLIQDLLTYSRVARHQESFESVDLKDVFKQVLNDLELKIQEKQATITFENLPIIDAQSFQMYQLFQNLLTNALKFAKSEGHPVIIVKCRMANPLEVKENPALFPFVNYYRITVSDNGIGLEEEYAERIFALFQRLHGRSEYEGTGLGLAICRKIVEGHQGQIKATGISGVGAEFIIYLPETQKIITQ